MTIWVVAAKELTELFRDVRSVLLSILVPFVLFPLLFLVLEGSFERQRTEQSPENLRLGIVGEVILSPAELEGLPSLTELSGDGRSEVLTGELLAVIAEHRQILYNDRSEISSSAAMYLYSLLSLPAAEPALVTPSSLVSVYPGGERTGARLVTASATALLIFLGALVSLLPAAPELGAGEKQRQTLEGLLIVSGRRHSIFYGKLLAVTVMGVLGVLSFLLGVGLGAYIVPDLAGPVWRTSATLATMAILAVIVVVAVFELAVIELLISVVARSPREAQSFFLPLLFIVSAAAYTAVLTDVWHTPAWFGAVPLLNLAVAVKARILQAPLEFSLFLAVVENLAVSAILSVLGGRILRSEWVLKRS